ncbi:uncharacterized protein H6S33_008201 [Morchella sextelata]|uniref:uncharacterized protein n=1 Tax=Morchella sextelata TaxID=1174677 RepID=UPI001D0446B7|nr:uncharacterized protein H6S33_008201 [Morchella sextelata]KAH0603197.1 hypothetical protein H6S33_008201 [Morchella sextelata]
MRNYIVPYVRNCHTCQRSKSNTHGKLGVLRPLPIPKQPWQEVLMDFVTGLLESERCDTSCPVIPPSTPKMSPNYICEIYGSSTGYPHMSPQTANNIYVDMSLINRGDWVKWLPMAEFSSNNQVSASTKATPFFTNYSFHPRFTLMIKSLDRTPPSLNIKDFALNMKELHEHLRSNIHTSQDPQEQAVNTK